jgi:tRNA acetyltransferase TAN1
MFDQVEKTKEFSSRFIQRMIPLTHIGYASLEEIKTIAQPLLKKHFLDQSIEYCVEIKRRNCNNLESIQVIDALAALVGEKHKVNLTKPTKVILVEIFCVSFLYHFMI